MDKLGWRLSWVLSLVLGCMIGFLLADAAIDWFDSVEDRLATIEENAITEAHEHPNAQMDLSVRIDYLKKEQDGLKSIFVALGVLEKDEDGKLRFAAPEPANTEQKTLQSVGKDVDKPNDM